MRSLSRYPDPSSPGRLIRMVLHPVGWSYNGRGCGPLEYPAHARRLLGSEGIMSQPKNRSDSDMRPEYEFSWGVRGKQHEAYRTGTNVVFLDPDVAKAFPDSAPVNRALRLLLDLAKAEASTKRSA